MIRTTSQLIALHGGLEDRLAEILRAQAQLHPEAAGVLSRLADEDIQHKEMILKVYREGVTDAFEVGFLSKPMDEDEYTVREPKGSLGSAIKTILLNEDTVARFCKEAAKDANQLIPSLPQTFLRLAKRKEKRRALLESLA